MSHKTPSEYLNKIFLGEVASVHNYGAFVKIPGGNQQGLVHRTQVSSTVVDDAADVLQKGDRVWCKVIKINDDGKLALSMKVVNQGSGNDLDPNGVQIHQDELKRKSKPEHHGKKVITLEAVLNTTCTKCGTRGHQARDCFKSPDGKTYELIPEDDEEKEPPESEEILINHRERKEERRLRRKLKKEKKKKRDKERKRSSGKESDSSPEEREAYEDKKQKKKEEKAERKRKERRNSDNSRSSSPHQKKEKKT